MSAEKTGKVTVRQHCVFRFREQRDELFVYLEQSHCGKCIAELTDQLEAQGRKVSWRVRLSKTISSE